mmetsp:Transcript_8372/g.16840  ORF Transcript_8372/g.16840 Transcript_8372/m.16840 type:complete len:201 (+) Transcript_8372:399-1001(+)
MYKSFGLWMINGTRGKFTNTILRPGNICCGTKMAMRNGLELENPKTNSHNRRRNHNCHRHRIIHIIRKEHKRPIHPVWKHPKRHRKEHPMVYPHRVWVVWRIITWRTIQPVDLPVMSRALCMPCILLLLLLLLLMDNHIINILTTLRTMHTGMLLLRARAAARIPTNEVNPHPNARWDPRRGPRKKTPHSCGLYKPCKCP